jgi:aspartate kinase
VAEIVATERRSRVVVVSALAGVTDALLTLASSGPTIPGTRRPRALDALLARHLEAGAMVRDGRERTRLQHALETIAGRVAALLESSPGELSSAARDEVAAAGELWSSRLLAAVLRDRGLPAVWIDARDVLRTDGHYGNAAPDLAATRELAGRVVAPHLLRGEIVVAGGFIASNAQGATTTLGRGGSDCSAAVLGASLDADEIQIWTDVDGVLTADPRLVPDARLVRHLSYGEAHDLASFGAKVLHPGTIAPAVERGIPVVVRNSFRPHAGGTLVSAERRDPETAPLAGLACRAGTVLFEVIAHDGADEDEVVSRALGELVVEGVGLVLADLCGKRLVFTVEAGSPPEPLRRALATFADVRVTAGLATVTLVGEGLGAEPQIESEATRALRDHRVLLAARPDGKCTLSFVVDRRSAVPVMLRLHERFFGAAGRAAADAPVVQA